MRKAFFLFLLTTFSLTCSAKKNYIAGENPVYFDDSLYKYVKELCDAWVAKDTIKIMEFSNRFLNGNLPKSQFYYFANTLEYLSGISFGAYEDSEEFAPASDSDMHESEMKRIEIIRDFYKRIIDNNFIFCHYPKKYRYYFDTLLIVSFKRHNLDTILFKYLKESLDMDIERNNISLINKIYPYKLGELNNSTYYLEISAKFALKDKDYFSDILFKLEDRYTDDTAFFEIANALFNVIQLKFYPDSEILITDYNFVNDRNYMNLKKYIIFFFKAYFDSKLRFSCIPLEKRNYIFNKFYKEDYSNIEQNRLLINQMNRLFYLITQ